MLSQKNAKTNTTSNGCVFSPCEFSIASTNDKVITCVEVSDRFDETGMQIGISANSC